MRRLHGSSDKLALAYNHIGGPSRDHLRTDLFVAISSDQGKTWNKIAELETVHNVLSKWHYPTLAQDECRLLVAYSSMHNAMYPFDNPPDIGAIHLAEIDLRRADLSEKTRLVEMVWPPPPTEDDFLDDGGGKAGEVDGVHSASQRRG
jgi:hypothetical protein